MITEEEFNSLGDLVESYIAGARPVEEAQTELLYAILKELRALRKSNEQLAKQFDQVSASGNVLATERMR